MSSVKFGLYYPRIHFQDDNWVKAAALYWDKMARIVPQEYEELHDSPIVRRLQDEDFIKNYTPPETAIRKISHELLKVIHSDVETLRKNFGVADPFAQDLIYIFWGKMDQDLIDTLMDAQLATYRRRKGDENNWVGVHPRLGQAYMTALASEMAQQGNLEVVSDDEHFAVAGCGFPIEQLFASLIESEEPSPLLWPSATENTLAILALQAVLPKNLDTVPVERIVEVRHELALERTRFNEAIGKLGQDLEKVQDPQILTDQLDEHLKKVDEQTHDLQQKMNALLGDTVLNLIGISKDLPVLPATLLGGLLLTQPWITVAGCAWSLVKAIRKGHYDQQKLKEHQYAYLVSLEEKLSSGDLISRIKTGARHLILG